MLSFRTQTKPGLAKIHSQPRMKSMINVAESFSCAVLLAMTVFNTVAAFGDTPNLVPVMPATAPNYWCTWYSQNYWIGRGTDLQDLKTVTNSNAREELNYDTIYNENDGWATSYLKKGRQDYIFLIDHGSSA